MAAPELSSEQKVAYFQEVTGLSDQSQCIQALEAHGWDLDAAVATILAIRDRDDAGPSSLNEERSQYDGAGPSFHAGSSDDTGYDSRNYESGSIQPAQAPNIIWRTLSLPGAVARGGLGLAFGAIGLGLWAASGVLSSVGSAASWALGGDAARQLSAETEARKFIRSFESEYGMEHPNFQDLSFMQAVKLAQEQFKFLLVYLHSPEHVNTPNFCRHVLTAEPVTQYLNETFVIWGGSVRSAEGFSLSLSLKASTFPYLAVVTGSSSQRVALLHCSEGPTSSEALLERLARVVEEQGAVLVAAQADEEERALNRRLREEQDAAYEASVQADREREEARQAEEERKRKEAEEAERVAREEQERIEAEERSAREREAALEKRRAEKAAILGEEPAKGPNVTQVLVRLPNGDRVERRFDGESPVQAVYDWVDTLKSMEHVHYSLLTSFPRVVYGPDKRQMTMKEAGLHPRAGLFVKVDED